MKGETMKPRSVVFDIFGSYVRHRGGVIGLSSLVEALSWFGITEDAARVTLARMRREAWFTSQREGRSSYYTLSQRGWQLLDQGRQRIFERHKDEWDGQWRVVVYSIPEEHRVTRESFRKELNWRGFASLAPSTWISPWDRADGLSEFLPEGAYLNRFSSRTPSHNEDVALARRCWDVDSLATDYRTFIAKYAPESHNTTTLELTPQESFVTRTLMTYEYRRFPFRDPDLPLRLLPAAWPGHVAHSVFRSSFDRLAEPAWQAFEEIYEEPPTHILTKTG